ncbi:MAG: rRNA maturation RNase YbeY [Alphaproteobacteria bacterium]|nr:MAG: rRNA maturation RNase YbeY [Alphaproteobacteria bacterium]
MTVLTEPRPTPLPFTLELALTVEEEGWDKIFSAPEAEIVTFAALSHLDLPERAIPGAVVEVSIVLTNDAAIQKLNLAYRGKDTPTNVLSFPDTELSEAELRTAAALEEPLLLGDIVMARETLMREAKKQEKALSDHLAHLLVHGLLHLVGYDHIEDNEAEEMERLEIAILETMNIANPYETSLSARETTGDAG